MITKGGGGFEVGDMIVSVQGTPTREVSHARALMMTSSKERTIQVEVLRSGVPRTVQVVVEPVTQRVVSRQLPTRP
jgi:type II secretory pathway component PulC